MSIVLKNGQQVIFLFDCEYIYELPNLLFGYIIKFDKSKIEIDTIKSITPTSNDTYKFIQLIGSLKTNSSKKRFSTT